MTEKNIFTVTDLGGGDGGKGGVVHKICVQKKAHTVVKVGGAQGSHGVRTSRGESFNFSHFGCGTFEGVRTHISDRMIIEPLGFLKEGNDLKFEHGISNVFGMVTLDENALCVTPFHTFTSRIRELARKSNPKGTVGLGVGETLSDLGLYPELAIRVKDITHSGLVDKLEAVRKQKIYDLREILNNRSFLDEDLELAEEYISLLKNKFPADYTADQFKDLVKQVRVVDRGYLARDILSLPGTVVVEASHGILTDKYYGFHPHTTTLRTIPQVTHQMIEECNYDGKVFKLGVTRAYQIRHGAGPMVTDSPDMVEELLPGSNKDENRWQGKVRVGPLDLIALKYSIDVCGGPDAFDGIALTWFDQIQTIGRWDICDNYAEHNKSLKFFNQDGSIRVLHDPHLKRQQELGEILNELKPLLTSYDVPHFMSNKELVEFCKGVLEPSLGIPLCMISTGPTEKDKIVF